MIRRILERLRGRTASGASPGDRGEPAVRGEPAAAAEARALERVADRLRMAAGPDAPAVTTADARRAVLGRLAGAQRRRRRVRLAGALLGGAAILALATGTLAVGPAAVADTVGGAVDAAIAIVRARLEGTLDPRDPFLPPAETPRPGDPEGPDRFPSGPPSEVPATPEPASATPTPHGGGSTPAPSTPRPTVTPPSGSPPPGSPAPGSPEPPGPPHPSLPPEASPPIPSLPVPTRSPGPP